MSKLRIAAESVFSPDYHPEDPAHERFYEAIRQTVMPLINEHTPEEVEQMKSEEWAEYRNKFLGVEIMLKPDGEIVYE